jgi:hypothetical protein
MRARWHAGLLSGSLLLVAFHSAASPADELVRIVWAFAAMAQPAEWSGIEALPGIRWAALPPNALRNCAPDGSCFTRQGVATLDGRSLQVIATGARTMVFNIYFRNAGPPIGEAAVVTALRGTSLEPMLVRCPIRGGNGTTNWYRLGAGGVTVGHLAIQSARSPAGEGFVLSSGAQLPKLQPTQLALYSTQCAPGAAQPPVATTLPHQQLATTVVALLARTGARGHDWAALGALPTGISWDAAGARRGDLSFRNDRNPFNTTGTVTYGGREFSLQASGTQQQALVIYLDEVGLHPRGEHMLGEVYKQGVTVQLDHCGPAYTESTANWYRLSSARTQPALIRQSIRYDGNQVQDTYELRLDGSQPRRDPRDRAPGVGGCQ